MKFIKIALISVLLTIFSAGFGAVSYNYQSDYKVLGDHLFIKYQICQAYPNGCTTAYSKTLPLGATIDNSIKLNDGDHVVIIEADAIDPYGNTISSAYFGTANSCIGSWQSCCTASVSSDDTVTLTNAYAAQNWRLRCGPAS